MTEAGHDLTHLEAWLAADALFGASCGIVAAGQPKIGFSADTMMLTVQPAQGTARDLRSRQASQPRRVSECDDRPAGEDDGRDGSAGHRGSIRHGLERRCKHRRRAIPPLLPLVLEPYFLGSPETVIERFAELRDCGVGVTDMVFVIGSQEQQIASLRLFAERVLPTIHAWDTRHEHLPAAVEG